MNKGKALVASVDKPFGPNKFPKCFGLARKALVTKRECLGDQREGLGDQREGLGDQKGMPW